MPRDTISLNKYISSTGICSRREADQWISEGRITLNGEIAVKGNRVGEKDIVKLDGKEVRKKVRPIYIMLNKPPGITSTTDKKDKDNIIDFLNFDQRIFPIGRLDKDSTGLILLTNDGDIVNQVLRKENRHEKEYIVKVDKVITPNFLLRMSRPIPMLGTKTLPCELEQINSRVFKTILTQGLNRQIRRMTEFCGYKVIELKRIRIMHLKLGKLKEGAWRMLTKKEIDLLLKSKK
jgi:23S rRNA pseudouridine2604 synthase